jgi:hypothetical protein
MRHGLPPFQLMFILLKANYGAWSSNARLLCVPFQFLHNKADFINIALPQNLLSISVLSRYFLKIFTFPT